LGRIIVCQPGGGGTVATRIAVGGHCSSSWALLHSSSWRAKSSPDLAKSRQPIVFALMLGKPDLEVDGMVEEQIGVAVVVMKTALALDGSGDEASLAGQAEAPHGLAVRPMRRCEVPAETVPQNGAESCPHRYVLFGACPLRSSTAH